MTHHNGSTQAFRGPGDLRRFESELGARLAAAGGGDVAAEVRWMDAPVPGFRVVLREGGRTERFGVPTRVLATDRSGRTLERIVADALRRLRTGG